MGGKTSPGTGKPKKAPEIANGEILQAEDFEMRQSSRIPWHVTTQSRWSKWWWSKKNRLCKRCRGACKQSWLVTLSKCPQFEARGKA